MYKKKSCTILKEQFLMTLIMWENDIVWDFAGVDFLKR